MDIYKAVKRAIDEVYPDNELILFGSRARGDALPDSDWDFVIILNKQTIPTSEKDDIREMLYDIELETGAIISSIIFTLEEWENQAVSPLYQNVIKEGVGG